MNLVPTASTYPPTYPSIHLAHVSTYPPTHLLTYPPTHQSTYIPTHPPINLPTHLSTFPPTHLSIFPPTYQPTYPPINLPTHPPTYQPSHSPTYHHTYLPNYVSAYPPTHLLPPSHQCLLTDTLTAYTGFLVGYILNCLLVCLYCSPSDTYCSDIGACEMVLKTKTRENFERRLRAEHSM